MHQLARRSLATFDTSSTSMRVLVALGSVLVLAQLASADADAVDAPTAAAAARRRSCTRQAADVAHMAAATCGATPVEVALRSVTMPAVAARRASDALAGLGFATALDLQLLGGGEAAAELLAELKAAGLNFADRAKVRLLVGDRAHLERLSISPAIGEQDAGPHLEHARSQFASDWRAHAHGGVPTPMHHRAAGNTAAAASAATSGADSLNNDNEPTASYRRTQATDRTNESSQWNPDMVIVVSGSIAKHAHASVAQYVI